MGERSCGLFLALHGTASESYEQLLGNINLLDIPVAQNKQYKLRQIHGKIYLRKLLNHAIMVIRNGSRFVDIESKLSRGLDFMYLFYYVTYRVLQETRTIDY